MARYLSAEHLTRDDFGVRFTRKEGELVYDAVTHGGPWATMTHNSWLIHSHGRLGMGQGQKYRRQADGKLVLIEGGEES